MEHLATKWIENFRAGTDHPSPLTAKVRTSRRRRLPEGLMRLACDASHINFGRFDETDVAAVFFTKVIGVTLRESSEST